MLDASKAARIRLLALDVDGVLTDNAVFIGEVDGKRVEFKRFDIQDGLGHALLRTAGIDVAWVSGRHSAATAMRGEELRVTTLHQGHPSTKVPMLAALIAERGLTWDEVAFVGDDLADLGVLEKVGLPIAVANAREDIKAVCSYVTAAAGGYGAVREVIDLLIQSRGQWSETVAKYKAAKETPS
jgi:3-deoxy-D-manno-octulosonate 8-phosphate phosphatase (KDO 8-P phosphatase)